MPNKQLLAIIGGILALIIIVVGAVLFQRRSASGPATAGTAIPPVTEGVSGESAGAGLVGNPNVEAPAVCGNGQCESGESPETCRSDCRPNPIQAAEATTDGFSLELNPAAVSSAVVSYGLNGDDDQIEVGADQISQPIEISGLEKGQVYEYTIRAKDLDGNDLPPIGQEFYIPLE
jgi:hypothetical protein